MKGKLLSITLEEWSIINQFKSEEENFNNELLFDE